MSAEIDTLPIAIRATDLGEFWIEGRGCENEDVLLCCSDPEGSDHEAVQPGTAAMDLMKELAKRYNAHDAMLQALKLIQLNARTALEYARKEGNDIAAAARLANIENWPGFVAAKKAISKAERNR